MQVILSLSPKGNGCCTVHYEGGDPLFHGTKNAAGESRLLYHVKQALKAQGYDFVKKRMYKDGHMVSEMQQYLRERNFRNKKRCLVIYNDHWAIEGAEVDFNLQGKTTLRVINVSE